MAKAYSSHINLSGGRSYAYQTASGLLDGVGKVAKDLGLAGRKALIVSQSNVKRFHGQRLHNTLHRAGFEVAWYIPNIHPDKSESCKSFNEFQKLCEFASKQSASAKSIYFIAFGGGVIGDVTGFAASVIRRGVPYLQIPTTVTAQVDSSIGGKTAIDLPIGKNLLGTIYQPRAVLADVDLLETLPERYWSDGFAEIIKYALIADPKLYHILQGNNLSKIRKDSRLLREIVFRCAAIKASVVSKDEYDTRSIRIILNFGHTFGHAIEAVGGYTGQYTHGEAVGLGMICATDIARQLNILQQKHLQVQLPILLQQYKLPTKIKKMNFKKIQQAIGYDKKNHNGKNRFVLPVRVGKTICRQGIPSGILLKAFNTIQTN